MRQLRSLKYAIVALAGAAVVGSALYWWSRPQLTSAVGAGTPQGPKRCVLIGIGGLNGQTTFEHVYSAPLDEVKRTGRPIGWTSCTPLPVPLHGHSVSFVDGRLIVTGGSSGTGTYSNDVHTSLVSEGCAGPWAAGAALPRPLAYHATVTDGRRLWVIGGQSPEDSDDIFTAEVEADGRITRWEVAGRLPLPLRGHAAVLYGGRLIVVGGHNQRGYSSAAYWSEIKDGRVEGWSETTSIPHPLAHLAAIVIGDRMLILGGQDADGGLYDEVYSAPLGDDGAGAWRLEKKLPEPSARMTVTLVGDVIAMTGGGFGWGPPIQSAVLIAESSPGGITEWRRAGELPAPMAFHAATVACSADR